MYTFSFFCRKDQRRLITYLTFLYQYGILLNYIKNQNKKQNYESQLHSYAHGFLQQRYMHIGGISDAITCHATFYIVPNMKKNQTKLKLFGSNPNKITKRKKAKSCTVASTMSITQRDNVQEQVSVCVTWRKISLSVQEPMFTGNNLRSLIIYTQMPIVVLKFSVEWQVFKSHSPWGGLVFSQFVPNRFWSFQQGLPPLCPYIAQCIGLPQSQTIPADILGHRCHQDNLMLWVIPRRAA